MNKSKFVANLKEWLVIIAIFSVTFALLTVGLHFIRFPSVDGVSMYPTYQDGSQLVVLYTTQAKAGDVIVIWSDELDEYIVKRIIGIGGDHIEIKDSGFYLNGNKLDEDYIYEQNWIKDSDSLDITVPQDQVFVMGDNRNMSVDSRAIGTLPVSDIFGRVLFENTFF